MSLHCPLARPMIALGAVALLGALAGCGGGGGAATASDPISLREQQALERFNSTPISLRGQLLSFGS